MEINTEEAAKVITENWFNEKYEKEFGYNVILQGEELILEIKEEYASLFFNKLEEIQTIIESCKI